MKQVENLSEAKNLLQLKNFELYHGTNASLEDVRDFGLLQGDGDGLTGRGVYFTIDLDEARKYGKHIYRLTKVFDSCVKKDWSHDFAIRILSDISFDFLELFE